jgi:hypothetical protein
MISITAQSTRAGNLIDFVNLNGDIIFKFVSAMYPNHGAILSEIY